MESNHREVAQVKDERDIAVVPYLLYDALMERFEHTQKNLRLSIVISIVLAIGLTLSLCLR